MMKPDGKNADKMPNRGQQVSVKALENLKQEMLREEYDSMSIAQCQEFYELQKKAELIKGKKTPESSRALVARVAVLEAKTETVAMRAYL